MMKKSLKTGDDEEKAGAKPHIKWDEETIAEHDKERGTRMKIDEPDTPYHYYEPKHDFEEQDGAASPARSLSGKEDKPPLQWNELEKKLQKVGDGKSEWDNSDDEDSKPKAQFAERDAEGKKIEKDPNFAQKRKMHYNEFERVKAWRQAHALDDEEDEEDEEEDRKAD